MCDFGDPLRPSKVVGIAVLFVLTLSLYVLVISSL
jgi:hypothetical protein